MPERHSNLHLFVGKQQKSAADLRQPAERKIAKQPAKPTTQVEPSKAAEPVRGSFAHLAGAGPFFPEAADKPLSTRDLAESVINAAHSARNRAPIAATASKRPKTLDEVYAERRAAAGLK